MFRLSIVIPVYNKSNFTKACLKDLSELPNDHQIIVINNGSTDDTDSVLAEMKKHFEDPSKPTLNVIVNDKNLGFGKASNAGYRSAVESGTEVVLFLNNDIRVSKEKDKWTIPAIEWAKAGKLVSPTVGHLDKNLNFTREDSVLTDIDYNYLSGWCLAGSVETFDRLTLPGDDGPFSSEYWVYFEDTDLSLRAKELGIPFLIHVPPVTHFGRQTSSLLGINFLYSQSREIFVKKWKDRIK